MKEEGSQQAIIPGPRTRAEVTRRPRRPLRLSQGTERMGMIPDPRQIGDGDGSGPPIPGEPGIGGPSPIPGKSGMGMGMGIGGSVPWTTWA